MEAAVTSNFLNIQSALNVISLLQLTAFRYPIQAAVKDGATFDYIIVGAGSAGSVLANRLTEDPNVSVLLIEAGGDPPLESNLPGLFPYTVSSRVDWNYTTSDSGDAYQCHKNNVNKIVRGKVLGGCSSVNILDYVRGSPHDYDTWASITKDKSWKFENILPYFIKSERLDNQMILDSPTATFHGTKGPLGVTISNWTEQDNYLNAFTELGHKVVLDRNGNDTLVYSRPLVTVADEIRQSTANTFLSDVKERPNLHVLKNSLVTKINFLRKVAVSVTAIDDNGKKNTFKTRKEIIVSGGAINSPQLLMLSGIGPKKHLNSLGIKVIADLPVGENLQDHRFISVIYTTGPLPVQNPVSPHVYPFPAVDGFVALNKSQQYPDYQSTTLVINTDVILQLCYILFTFNQNICQSWNERTKGKSISYNVIAPLHAKSRGRILLKNTDPYVHPLIYTNAYNEEVDVEDAVKFVKEFSKLSNTTYFKSVGAEFLEVDQCAGFGVGSTEYWRCHVKCLVSTMWHQSGTCAMGSVVDSELRVRGVKNLRVVDVSVMPTITSGNTNVPTIMIAEKAADMIKKDGKRF